MRVLIIGCGYVGQFLGEELARQGHEVFGVRRSADKASQLEAAGIHALALDITLKDELARLPGPFDWVVNLASSSKGDVSDYRQIYVEGNRNLIEHFSAAPPKKYVYTSSTGVYGQTDGSQVKETSPTTPAAETAQVLVAAEQLLLGAFASKKFPALILRVAGIYGPERTHFLQQFITNQAKIAGRGERFMNMVHVQDLVGVIVAALRSGRPGEVYNVVDDEAVAQIHFFRWLSESLGKWMPPFSDETDSPDRKRGLTNKKVLNRKLKMELGYQFKYPTFRQGYTAEIQRLEQAGRLNIEPDPR